MVPIILDIFNCFGYFYAMDGYFIYFVIFRDNFAHPWCMGF